MGAREDIADATALAGLRVLIAVVLRAGGFSHVSDDDFARTVIAQGFAHAPRLDPSGTSWLPAPFWLAGAAMRFFGRELSVAVGTNVALAALGAAALYAGMRAAGLARGTAWVACALSAMMPWAAWTGAAAVPEGWSGWLVGAAAFTLASPAPKGALLGASALFVASLSRYEAWPVCALAAGVWCVRAVRSEHRGAHAAAALLAIAGPAAWIAWNAHVHGDALHFLARVAHYRKSTAGEIALAGKLAGNPAAMLRAFPAATALFLLGLLSAARDRELRTRFALPVAASAATFAFLVYGDLRDGAPTHNPERALLMVALVGVAFGCESIARWVAAGRRGRRAVPWVAGALAVMAAQRLWGGGPGRGSEGREAQLARGRALRDVSGTFVVYPCAYEHCALVAALGAPERVTIVDPPVRGPVGEGCPRVEHEP